MSKSKGNLQLDPRLYELTTMAAGNFSLPEVLDNLARAAVEITSAEACSMRLLDENAGELMMRSTFGLSEEYANRGVVSVNDAVIRDAFEGRAVVIDNMLDDSRVKHKAAAIDEKLCSQLTVGMHFRLRPIGVLRLYSHKAKRFKDDDITLARLVASQCAIAITNAKLYSEALEANRVQEQMKIAGVIQRRMIPEKPPCVAGLDIAGIYKPCFEIGGDLYDFMKIGDDAVDIVIADVIGKGIPAAIMMGLFRGTFRAFSDGGTRRHSMLEIIGKLNRAACRDCRNGEFITMFFAEIDIAKREMNYCSCGHEPAILLRDGEVIDLDKGGLVLGKISIKDGDCILFYTDGLADSVNFDDEFWGRERLIEAFKSSSSGGASYIANEIIRKRRNFVGLARQFDDTSIVVAKVDLSGDAEVSEGCG